MGGSRCSKGFVMMGARERCASRQTLRRRKECFEEREECLQCLDDKEGVCGCEGKSEGEWEDSPGEEEKKRGEFVFLSWHGLYACVGTLDTASWHCQDGELIRQSRACPSLEQFQGLCPLRTVRSQGFDIGNSVASCSCTPRMPTARALSSL